MFYNDIQDAEAKHQGPTSRLLAMQDGIFSHKTEKVTFPKETKDPFSNPNKPIVVTLSDVTTAAFLIKSGIKHSPCSFSDLSTAAGMDIYLKKEFVQYTGSFKERGARYALLMLSDDQKKRGVITESMGNHALALSYHACKLNIPASIVMPVTASITAIEKCRDFNAKVLVYGQNINQSKSIALKIAKDEELTYINGHDHPHMIAGEGTIALEILNYDQIPTPDAVVVPVGGGGLLAGIATVIKELSPKTKVIGVESEKVPSFLLAMQNGAPIATPSQSSIANSLAVPKVGYNSFAAAKMLLDKMITVKEQWISLAMLRLREVENCVVEGAAASPLAAILSGQLTEFKGQKVVLILTGGNVEPDIFQNCLERGLATEGRLVRFTVRLNDCPGAIAELCNLVASIQVSIKDIMYERTWLDDVNKADIRVECKTKDWNHTLELKNVLTHKYDITFVKYPLME